ncbi:MAG TPA: hypothetical protein VF121_15670 [Thermoanaerobaculia bacterium]|nr:hypothetical protein [Thermoanaerobaculia bacterium]
MKTSISRPLVLSFLLLAAAAAASATEITFAPAPPVAGQPFTITFHGVDIGCFDEGTLEVERIAFNTIDLEVFPPGCAVIPIGTVDYTASVAVGPLAAGTYEVRVFQLSAGGTFVLLDAELIQVKQPPACDATETSLCLRGGRFEVTAEWTDFQGNTGVAHTMPDDFDGLGDWGVFWFFGPENPEMLVKVLDGCAVNDFYWIFLSPASTVRYEVTVRDVVNGLEKTYPKPLHEVPELFADTRAFSCLVFAP